MAAAPYNVAGRTVLITGASRGIGAETARQLGSRGANVALVGLEPEHLDEVAVQIGGRAAPFAADVRDTAQVEAAVAAAVERFGGIDIVIANAGVATGGSFLDLDPAGFEATIDINLCGVWRTLRAAAPFVVQRRGYLVGVASLAAAMSPPFLSAYSASKAGVESMCDSLRMELRPRGVAVGVAYFGWIDTEMVRTASASYGFFDELVRRSRLPVLPVSAAGAAMVRGIERRARRIIAPRRIAPLILGARLLRPLVEAQGQELVERAIGEGMPPVSTIPPRLDSSVRDLSRV
ncbi:MAG TPA: short-chain dehydrogenase/reductase [Candidatus Dormibacteraeota bacterium]|nr:short-chain dehydrogenase/reductase [Candidatus Dormibacteraeota bacterium]